MTKIVLLLAAALSAVACGASSDDSTPVVAPKSDASTAGIGRECPTDGCAKGQECVTANGPEGELSTCEIRCTSNAECPEGLRCNLPPVLPDSLVNVCVE
jgi:hypothetical protein